MGLTKQAFKKYCMIVDEWFINDFNGKKAYQKHYKSVKDSTASTNFNKIMKHPEVIDYVKQKREDSLQYFDTTHKGILNELKNWVECDITQTISLTPDEIKELPLSLRKLINKFKETSRDIYNKEGKVIETIKTIEISFVSKERAMEMINKHTDFYNADNTSSAPIINVTTSNKKHKSIVDNILKGNF